MICHVFALLCNYLRFIIGYYSCIQPENNKTDRERMAYNPNAEVNRLDQRIDEVTDETLDATRRILQTAEETNRMGVDTLVTLNEQGG